MDPFAFWLRVLRGHTYDPIGVTHWRWCDIESFTRWFIEIGIRSLRRWSTKSANYPNNILQYQYLLIIYRWFFMIHFNGRLAPIFIDACLGSKRPGKPPPYITPERSRLMWGRRLPGPLLTSVTILNALRLICKSLHFHYFCLHQPIALVKGLPACQ